ncbi:MAG: alpha-L-fucosidase, partial [Spirochaetia bacterium]|nr:alpha-L-fucosidase [Spirochaetia bacterium]
PMGKNWKYVSNDINKSTGELVRMLVETVSKGGNLMLGVGPSPEGKIEGEVRSRLDGIGRWLKVNGDAIYETNPLAPYAEENIFYTEKRRVRYAIVFADTKTFAGLRLKTIRPESGDEIHMLGVGRLSWREDKGGALVSLPENIRWEHAFVLAIHRGSPSS